VTTKNGMVVELGRVEMQARLDKFARVYSTTIAGLNKKIAYADLRYPNGFAVRRPVEASKKSDVEIKNLKPVNTKATDEKARNIKPGTNKYGAIKQGSINPVTFKNTDINRA
jgi:cell division protein FtsQ